MKKQATLKRHTQISFTVVETNPFVLLVLPVRQLELPPYGGHASRNVPKLEKAIVSRTHEYPPLLIKDQKGFEEGIRIPWMMLLR
jgi:hypothetical protein